MSKILTQCPQGKQGVNISRRKHDAASEQLTALLADGGGLTFTELAA